MRNLVLLPALAVSSLMASQNAAAQVRIQTAPGGYAYAFANSDRPMIGVSTRSSGKRDTLGLLVGGAAWGLSGGDAEVLDSVITAAVRGDYVVTPEHIRMERGLEFYGRAPQYREVALLVGVEGMQPTEVAQILGQKPEAIRQRLARARAQLASALGEHAPAAWRKSEP